MTVVIKEFNSGGLSNRAATVEEVSGFIARHGLKSWKLLLIYPFLGRCADSAIEATVWHVIGEISDPAEESLMLLSGWAIIDYSGVDLNE